MSRPLPGTCKGGRGCAMSLPGAGVRLPVFLNGTGTCGYSEVLGSVAMKIRLMLLSLAGTLLWDELGFFPLAGRGPHPPNHSLAMDVCVFVCVSCFLVCTYV